MATEKRERQKANRQLKAEETRRANKQQEMRRRGVFIAAITAAVLAALFFVYLTGQDDETATGSEDTTPLTLDNDATSGTDETSETDTTETDSSESTDSSQDDETTSDEPAVTAPAAGASIDGDTPCPASDGSSERVTSFASAPPECIDPSATYTAELVTTKGTFSIALDTEAAPITVNNFVVLARYHYYDGAPFHRIIPDFVIQGGDAVGAPLGTGNPGYAIEDELPEAGEYQIGSVAMANSGPDTNGSQFFVITGERGAALDPNYSLFGQVTEGMDVVEAIEAIPTAAGDVPTEPIYIESVTITES